MVSSPSGNPKKGIACVVDVHVPSLKALARLLSAVGVQAVPFDNPRLFLEYAKDSLLRCLSQFVDELRRHAFVVSYFEYGNYA
jgi:hypothetical protein